MTATWNCTFAGCGWQGQNFSEHQQTNPAHCAFQRDGVLVELGIRRQRAGLDALLSTSGEASSDFDGATE
jgi:hypothetical protein